MNKELLIKHKFWVMLGLFALLWLVAVSWLGFTAGAEIKKNKEAYDKAKKEIDEALKRGPKNETTFLPPWKAHQKMFQDHKNVIWEKAWDHQKGMYIWPSSNTARLQEKMVAPIVPMTLDERTEYRDTLYRNQLNDLQNELRNTPPNPIAPVEMRGGFQAIMAPVSWIPNEAPTREEIWLAQEDFWVKKDLLDVVRAVVDGEARMEPVKIDPKEPLPEGLDPKKVLSRHRYRNHIWEIDLIIERGADRRDKVISGHSTIKNIHPGQRILPLANPLQQPLFFRIRQGRNQPLVFTVTGEPLPPGGKTEFKKEQPVQQIDFDKLTRCQLTERALPALSRAGVPVEVLTKLAAALSKGDFKNEFKDRDAFLEALGKVFNKDEMKYYKDLVVRQVETAAVAQVFDWYSSPVKRLDALKLGAQSARTVTTALKPNTGLPQDGPKEETASGGGTGAGGAQGGGGKPGTSFGGGSANSNLSGSGPPAGKGGSGSMMPSGMSMGMIGGAGGGGGASRRDQASDTTPVNKLERNRYLQAKQECRHLPIGMVLIVDQENIPDVLAEIANSRLRIQVTQVQIQHVRGIKPEAPPGDKAGAPANAGGTNPPAGGSGLGPMGMPGVTPGAGNTGTTQAAAKTEDDPNLVELAVYGIAALYENFEAFKAKAAAGSGGSGPGGPAPGGPAAKR